MLKELAIQDGDMQRDEFGVMVELSNLITKHNEQFPKYSHILDIYHNCL